MSGFSASLYIKYEALADFQDNAERNDSVTRDDMQKLHNKFTRLIEHELKKGGLAVHSQLQKLILTISAQLRHLSPQYVS